MYSPATRSTSDGDWQFTWDHQDRLVGVYSVPDLLGYAAELGLAKAEMAVKAKEGGKGAGFLGGAGVAGLLTLIALTLTLIGLLDTFMKYWIAALIVTVLWGAVAAVLALSGKNKLQEAAPPVPEQTQETLKEDVEWAKTQKRSAAR